MMKPKRVAFTPVTGAADNIALSQTPAGAVNVTLNGALAVGGVIPDLLLGYIVSFSSTSDISTRTFLITGFDQDNHAQTETVTGPNNATVVSAKFWRQITTIAISGAAAGAITIGTPNTTLCAVTPTYCVDSGEPYTSVTADIGGTINFTLQKCSERPTAGETPNWRTLQAAGAIDVEAAQVGPIGAVRAQINTYTNTATLALSILQTRLARA